LGRHKMEGIILNVVSKFTSRVSRVSRVTPAQNIGVGKCTDQTRLTRLITQGLAGLEKKQQNLIVIFHNHNI
jgi:uncharacterized membrane protein YjjP (DUF1212 family)